METTSNNKLGTRNWKSFAGTRLWVIGKLLQEMRPMGLSFAVFPGCLFHVRMSSKFVRDACKLYRVSYFLVYIFFSFPLPPLHWARLRALGLT